VGVSDYNGTTIQSYALAVANVNDAPEITSEPITEATQGEMYSYDVDATDVDNDSLIYSLTTHPEGMMIDASSGLITWIPDNSQVGNNTVTAQVSDGNLTDSQTFIVTVENVNDAPNITSTPITTAKVHRLYQYQVDAYDPDNDTISYSLLVKPRRMIINRNTGLILWFPLRRDIGKHDVVVQASDGSLTDTQTYVLKVTGSSGRYFSREDIVKGGYHVSETKGGVETITIENDELPIIRLDIISKDSVAVDVEALQSRPKETERIDRNVYQYVRIENLDAGDLSGHIEKATIKFKVKKSWLIGRNLSEDDIVLSRYNGKRWIDLETIMGDKDDDHVYYDAESSGFSYFAITIKGGVEAGIPVVRGGGATIIKTPYRIMGRIYEEHGKEVEKGTPYTIINLNTGEMVEGETGIGPYPGGYLALIYGEVGDEIEIMAGDNLQKVFSGTIKGESQKIDIVMNEKRERKGLLRRIIKKRTAEPEKNEKKTIKATGNVIKAIEPKINKGEEQQTIRRNKNRVWMVITLLLIVLIAAGKIFNKKRGKVW
jgi:PGF-pre-PGF domain-containing protein